MDTPFFYLCAKMEAGDAITWKTANGEARGVVLKGDGVGGYLVRLANGRHAIVCPDYKPSPRRGANTKEETNNTK